MLTLMQVAYNRDFIVVERTIEVLYIEHKKCHCFYCDIIVKKSNTYYKILL